MPSFIMSFTQEGQDAVDCFRLFLGQGEEEPKRPSQLTEGSLGGRKAGRRGGMVDLFRYLFRYGGSGQATCFDGTDLKKHYHYPVLLTQIFQGVQ